ncbi:MAG: hypothetical protein LM580_06885 [Thermofilum sp.]|nr:hypothetical protein [Thermofilum sp.]MCC6065267.1 hypothetical protein [Thermofilum sp.]
MSTLSGGLPWASSGSRRRSGTSRSPRARGGALPLAGTGAVYTVPPRSLPEEMGVKSAGERGFKLADNQIVERDAGIVGIEVQGVRARTIAVSGGEGVYLLGTTTLEELRLEVDPVKGKLGPMELSPMLKQAQQGKAR